MVYNANELDAICAGCNAVPGEAHTSMTATGAPCTPQNRSRQRDALVAQLAALEASNK